MQVEKSMFDSIINLRGPSKSHKDKLRFRVSNIMYKTQDTEHNSTYERHILERNTTPEK